MPLHRMALDKMQLVDPRITEEVFSVLSVDRSVKSRTSYGGTAPANVRREARRWLKRLAAFPFPREAAGRVAPRR